jgi:hypothetical protein
MSEENEKSGEKSSERGLLTDIFMFLVLGGLALAAIYFTGNWPWFMKMVANLDVEIRDFIKMFKDNLGMVADTVQSTQGI